MTDASGSTLYLLRHAHSSWAQPGQRDHQRPLDGRGRSDALALGLAIADAGYAIDAVVCSTATRAAETFAAVRPHLPADVAVEASDALYALGLDAYLAAVHAQRSARSLLLVGHNPMIEEFALALTGTRDSTAGETLADGFPTAGLAIIDFPTGLADVVDGSGHLRQMLHPRDRRS